MGRTQQRRSRLAPDPTTLPARVDLSLLPPPSFVGRRNLPPASGRTVEKEVPQHASLPPFTVRAIPPTALELSARGDLSLLPPPSFVGRRNQPRHKREDSRKGSTTTRVSLHMK